MSYCKRVLMVILAFSGGFSLGQAYYYFLLKQIPFPDHLRSVVALSVSGILGVGNAVAVQIRCISALTLPMFCGKPGRAFLKAVVLTYIVAGPITNMGLNAREIVRVFSCTTQLSHKLYILKYTYMHGIFVKTGLGVKAEVDDFKNIFGSFNEVIEPIQNEIADFEEVDRCRYENDFIDDLLSNRHRSLNVKWKLGADPNSTTVDPVTNYQKKIQYRCENQLSRAVAVCIEEFSKAYIKCSESVPKDAEYMLCWPLLQTEMCDLISALAQSRPENCDSNSQDAKETAERVKDAFEQKAMIMHFVFTIMNICIALLFLRIFNAAVTYHDLYLTDIDNDNVYVTTYFKTLDLRRKNMNKTVLLPLKKMERNKYVDIHTLSCKYTQQNFVSQVLKVMLEVVTATTFVMLDRLFYEALDMVRQHAEMDTEQHPTRDLEVEVEGKGLLAAILCRLLDNLSSYDYNRKVANTECLPRPRLMPYLFYFKIYGGYLWILLLWLMNPYTSRLRRTVCYFFYPRREKQRILHLYNDILKKRMKMDTILRRKAVQAVRAYYLTGESLLSMRMKFPQVLGWLRVLPAARMTCLICGEVEPRTKYLSLQSTWYSCRLSNCPFVYCPECWREAGRRCLACDPSLTELSDIDSHTEDERPAY